MGLQDRDYMNDRDRKRQQPKKANGGWETEGFVVKEEHKPGRPVTTSKKSGWDKSNNEADWKTVALVLSLLVNALLLIAIVR